MLKEHLISNENFIFDIPATRIACAKSKAFRDHIRENASGQGEKAWLNSIMSTLRMNDAAADLTW